MKRVYKLVPLAALLLTPALQAVHPNLLECELAAQEALLDLKAAREEVSNLKRIPAKVLGLADRKIKELDFVKLAKTAPNTKKAEILKYFSGVRKGVIGICKKIDTHERELDRSINNCSKFISDVLANNEGLDVPKMQAQMERLCKESSRIKIAHARPSRLLLDLEFGLFSFDPNKLAMAQPVVLAKPKKKPASQKTLDFKAQSLRLASAAHAPALASKRKPAGRRIQIPAVENRSLEENVTLLSKLEKEINMLGRSINRLSSQIGYDLDSLEKFGERLKQF